MANKLKRSKSPDTRPARGRYWASGRLAEKKIRNLMKYKGFETEAKAKSYWLSVHKRNVK